MLSDETLLWSGKPRAGFLFRNGDWFAIPFGVLFFAFGITIFVTFILYPPQSAPDQPPPPWPLLIFMPLFFAAVGAYVGFGRLLWERWVRSRSAYGLTDRRAIFMQQRLQKTIRAISLKEIAVVELVVGRDGVGTITFNGTPTPWNPLLGFALWGALSGAQSAPAFELIEGARDVYKLVSETRAKA